MYFKNIFSGSTAEDEVVCEITEWDLPEDDDDDLDDNNGEDEDDD